VAKGSPAVFGTRTPPEWIEDVTQGNSLTRIGAAIFAGIHGALAVPLGLFQGILGVMVFFSQEKKAFDEEPARFLMSTANQMGQFIARKFANRNLILDPTSEGIYGVNLAGAITFINQSAARMLGCNRQEVVGQDVHTFFHHTPIDGPPHPASECPLTRMLRSAKSFHSDVDSSILANPVPA
jgi:PAS domain-containing protein